MVAKIFAEKRQSPRQRVNYPAWIDTGDGGEVQNCTLFDISGHGARIVVKQPDAMPEEFSLVLSNDGSIRRRCRVVWRSDAQVGVQYLGEANLHWTTQA